MKRIISVLTLCFSAFFSANATDLFEPDTIREYLNAGEAYWWDTNGDGEVDTVYTYSGVFKAKTKEGGKTVEKILVLTFTPGDAGPLGCDAMLRYNNDYAPDTVFINTKVDTTIEFTSGNDELDSYEWVALNAKHKNRIANPSSPTTTITVPPQDTAIYVLKTTKISNKDYEMVFNGDFEYGNMGFTSEFTYKERNDGSSAGSFGWGVYAIGVTTANHPKYYRPGDFNGDGWAHYPMTGAPYLFADGQQKAGGQAFYSTTFTVEPHQDYIFQAKFANLDSGGSFNNPGTDYAIFRFFVNGKAVSEYDTLKSTWGEWQTLYTTFNTEDDTLATVTVKNFGISQNGNDFCLDDVSFLKFCQTADTIVVINDYTIRNTIEVEICDNETYDFNGKVLDEEGYYIDTLKTAVNIDSIITLHLIVNPTYETFLDTTVCEDVPVEFNGRTYYQTGDYKAELKTESGCDSTVYLHMVVNKKSYKNIEETIYSWENYYLDDSLITDDGVYTKILVNQAGCDSIITLTLHYNDKVYISRNICEGEEFMLGDRVLTKTGVYSDTLTAANGNDSIVMVSLTVYPNYNDTIKAKIGVGQVYDRGGFYADEPGTYVQQNNSIYGCDSSIVLLLTVDSPVDIFAPNAFTPDGDINNVFYIYPASEDIVIDKFQIINRWGGVVFETNDIKQGWDGRYKGKFCQQGLYLYTVEYWRTGEKGKRYRKTGEVFLMN
ncbi:MAG: gliding motility-associated C-terminal domain-containing protein [Bacteroidales bacterium]|nr:gliding motility-associated C-terminal domain-containing protein [Bacteroidales bacterium]